ncbi:MAG TPA: DUF1800 domain-containing protein, partial [Quisquiliibacterium sp.]|nr:DUF1800 domain-containing protein [Quisquiliibacterium sp.]
GRIITTGPPEAIQADEKARKISAVRRGTTGTGGGTSGTGTTGTATTLPDAPTTRLDASRFLHQSAFGPNEATLAQVQTQGPRKFLVGQFAAPVSRYAYTQPEYADRDQIHVYLGDFCAQFAAGSVQRDNCWRDYYTSMPVQWDFFRQAVSGTDQLRQRVAFALGQIFVTSGVELYGAYGFAEYHQLLRDNAFGNFRDLLEVVTLSPFMGAYLNMVNNDGASPNENYARELLQLFSIGTCMLNGDGTLQSGSCIATYDNARVREYAYALSGWTFPPGGRLSWCNPVCNGWQNPPYLRGQMQPVAARHDRLQRTLLSNVTAAAGRTPRQGLDAVLTSLMAHQNVGPFIARRLIQFLVTSNPSPAYVGRVAAAFNTGRFSDGPAAFGTGTKGDMKATIAAILLDPEARDPVVATGADYGLLREPAIYTANAIRAIDGYTDGDRLGLWGWGAGMGQTVFNAPSVFNFYSPDFPLTGTTLVGPAFQIATTNTTFARINFANDLVYWWYNKGKGLTPNPTIPGATGTRIDTSRWENLIVNAATDSIKVVDRLNELLVSGRLTSAEKQAIVTAMDEWKPTDTWLTDANNMSNWKRERVKTAVYLILSSPQYQVQR